MSIDFDLIKKLNDEIERLLQERPQYRALQEEIKEVLRKAGDNQHNRCAMLQDFMLTKWSEIFGANDKLQYEVQKMNEEMKDDQ